jgi:hypothetical protein
MTWSFASERALRRATWAALGLIAAIAGAFYVAQNALHPVGGEIALVKLFWLAGAVLLWGVLPLLLAGDARLGPGLRRAFAALLALMLARAGIEGWMLYVSLNWSPWYGIGHDALCAGVLIVLAARFRPRNVLERAARGYLAVSAAFFVPEMYFAWYMLGHFVTRGERAVYFVPADPSHANVLTITTVAVVCLAVYLVVFLRRWILASGIQIE